MDIEVATTPWLWRTSGDVEALCAQAERAEALGFHSFWLPENHFGGRYAIPAPLMLLAAVAARTTSIRLGCTSYILPIRNPLLAAEEVAVLDRLCNGRLILGLGRGIQGNLFKAFGVASSDKRKLFQANLDVMRRAWRGEAVADGDNGEAVTLAPLPLQQPEPPLWVAAFGPLALKQVASLGLPYLASPLESLHTLAENYERFNALVEEAGHPAVGPVPVMRTVFVSDNERRLARVRESLAEITPPARESGERDVQDWAIVGDAAAVRERLYEYRERLGLTHLILRAGLPGVDEVEQLHSHETLLDIISAN